MKFYFSDHSQIQMRQREIIEEWIHWTFLTPDLVLSDSLRPYIVSFYKTIPDANQKVLRVVTKKLNSQDDYLIITCYFDRKMRGKL